MTIKPIVKKMKVGNHTYTKEKPNPEWKTKGEKWIDFALNKWKPLNSYDVAYISHVPIPIEDVHVAPTYWPYTEEEKKEDIPRVTNFKMGGGNNQFRLNARFIKNSDSETKFLGSKKNIDLNPYIEKDKDKILELLRLAEVIFEPGEESNSLKLFEQREDYYKRKRVSSRGKINKEEQIFKYIMDINPKSVKRITKEGYTEESGRKITRDEVGRHFSFKGKIMHFYVGREDAIRENDNIEFRIDCDGYPLLVESDDKTEGYENIKDDNYVKVYGWLTGHIQVMDERKEIRMMPWIHADIIETI